MPSAASVPELRAEFDEIASLTKVARAEPSILANAPARGAAALDVGCGVGELARQLASRFASVEGIVLSHGMIDAARLRTSAANVHFACADLFEWLATREATYDCIVTVATLHHVDLGAALEAMARALRPGGRLLVVDLMERRELFTNLVAYGVTAVRIATDMLRGHSSWRLRSAYRRHGLNETYSTIDEVRAVAAPILPGARITPTLLWRYRLLWKKPAARS